MSDCLFCKIINGDIPSNKIFENDQIYAFEDIAPMACGHVLFVHRHHSHDINAMSSDSPAQLAEVFSAIATFTRAKGYDKSGFRVVTNCGPNAGQTVFHSHFHVLFGEKLGTFGK